MTFDDNQNNSLCSFKGQDLGCNSIMVMYSGGFIYLVGNIDKQTRAADFGDVKFTLCTQDISLLYFLSNQTFLIDCVERYFFRGQCRIKLARGL